MDLAFSQSNLGALTTPMTKKYRLIGYLIGFWITTFNISLVVHGTVAEDNDFQKENGNPYDVPISMGIFKILDSPLDITTSTIIRRIVSNHEAYQFICSPELLEHNLTAISIPQDPSRNSLADKIGRAVLIISEVAFNAGWTYLADKIDRFINSFVEKFTVGEPSKRKIVDQTLVSRECPCATSPDLFKPSDSEISPVADSDKYLANLKEMTSRFLESSANWEGLINKQKEISLPSLSKEFPDLAINEVTTITLRK
ncbi:hypothetical protein HAX54_052741 [Datura stramonium]|uniref:Uncharacterized protein n=1 Tax=Datura stramonium TaxID=4076 RepID=A0ABS8SZY1_DATST|nr:hypothetical protein [Datura stramonium]